MAPKWSDWFVNPSGQRSPLWKTVKTSKALPSPLRRRVNWGLASGVGGRKSKRVIYDAKRGVWEYQTRRKK